MQCKKCGSSRIAEVGGKVSDMFNAYIGDKEYDGYVPSDLGIGSGDYIDFDYCMDCGHIVGEFPLPKAEMESEDEECS